MRGTRGAAIALGVSTVLHAVGFVVVSTQEPWTPAQPTTPPEVSMTALQVELHEPERSVAPSAKASAPVKTRAIRSSARVSPQPDPLPTGRGDDRALATPDLSAVHVAADAPPEAPRGRTLTPDDVPSAAERLADERAVVFGRVDGFVKSRLANARVLNGLPDPEYGQLGSLLRAATDEVPKLIDTDDPKQVLAALNGSLASGAERYGKTGAPYATPEGFDPTIERPSALAEAIADGSPDAIALGQQFAAGARLEEFADGRAGPELFALLEIRGGSAGAPLSVTLLRKSGVPRFDAWVHAQAAKVSDGFRLDGGARDRPLRSVWRFDAVVTFRRKLKLSEFDGRAALGLAVMSGLSMLSAAGNVGPDGRALGPRMPGAVGRFDEVTGEMDVVDFTNPAYDCRVTLLEAD